MKVTNFLPISQSISLSQKKLSQVLKTNDHQVSTKKSNVIYINQRKDKAKKIVALFRPNLNRFVSKNVKRQGCQQN